MTTPQNPEKRSVDMPRCENCGSDKMVLFAPGCFRCGSPNCCQQCCQITTLTQKLELAEKEVEALMNKLEELQNAK